MAIMACRRLFAFVSVLAAFFLQSLGRPVSAARTIPSGGIDVVGSWQDPNLQNIEAPVSDNIREWSEAQVQSKASEAWINPCGGFPGDGAWESGSTSHEPCFGPRGDLQFCCLSGSTGCSCPPWVSSSFNEYGCYNYEHENTLNANTGNECGYFLPTQTSQHGATARLLTVSNETVTGAINVTRADTGAFLGFLQSDYTKTIGLTTDIDNILLVSIPPGPDVALLMLNGPHAASTYPYLGFVVSLGSPSNDLSATSGTYAVLAATIIVQPNTGPSSVDTSYAVYDDAPMGESSIWATPAGSNVLTVAWTNTRFFDGPVPTFLCYLPDPDNFIFITGGACELAFPAAFPVELLALA